LLTELERISRHGFPAAELELNSAPFWLQQLLAAYRFGRDPAAVLEEATRLDHVTRDGLRRAARRYLRADQYLEAVLLPATPATADAAWQ
jgi:predicted Zn-dependent peptidase